MIQSSFDTVLRKYTSKLHTELQELDSELFDVALEGLSYVWLTYPELISERLEELSMPTKNNQVPLLKVLLNSMLA